jgi:hypothetical protein
MKMDIDTPARTPGKAQVPAPRPIPAKPVDHGRLWRSMLYRELRPPLPMALIVMAGAVVVALLARVGDVLNHRPVIPYQNPAQSLQPLMLAGCPLVGIALGIWQAWGDTQAMWAFAVHRPVARWRLFAARLAAGVLLYGMAAGVPIAIILLCAATSRSVPYHWRFLLPSIADLISGFAYVPAAMLVLRSRRRIWGARNLPLLGAVMGTVVVAMLPTFSAAAAFALIVIVIYVVAAWGAFQSDQYDLQAPLAARAARGIISFLGLSLLAWVVWMLASAAHDSYMGRAERALAARPEPANRPSVRSVVVLSDGTLARRTYTPPPPEIRNAPDFANRSSFEDSTYERIWPTTGPAEHNRGIIEGISTLRTVWIGRSRPYHQLSTYSISSYLNTGTYMEAADTMTLSPELTTPVNWWFVDPPGDFQGYEGNRLVGSIGPAGVVAPGKSAGSFQAQWPLYSDYDKQGDSIRRLTLWTPRGLYKMELNPPSVRLWRAMPADEQAVRGGWLKAGDEEWTALSSETRIHLYTGEDSRPRISLPLPGKFGLSSPILRRFPAQHRWILTAYAAEDFWASKLHQYFGIYDDAGKAVAEFTFTQPDPPLPADPQLEAFIRRYYVTRALINAACNVPVNEATRWLGRQASTYAPESQFDRIRKPWYAGTMAAVLLVSTAGMFFLARRYGARYWPVWMAATIALGPVMLLMLMAVRQRPQRETCAHCGRPRRVDATVCPCCLKPAPPPARRAIEIFSANAGGAA